MITKQQAGLMPSINSNKTFDIGEEAEIKPSNDVCFNYIVNAQSHFQDMILPVCFQASVPLLRFFRGTVELKRFGSVKVKVTFSPEAANI